MGANPKPPATGFGSPDQISAVARRLQGVAALALLLALFQPWVEGVGISANALQLREQLRGPARVLSWVTHKRRVERDVAWAGRAGWLGLAEAAALASAVWPALTFWPGLLTGAAAVGGAVWTRGEIGSYSLLHAGSGTTLTIWAGLLLFAVSWLRGMPGMVAWVARGQNPFRP